MVDGDDKNSGLNKSELYAIIIAEAGGINAV